MNIQVLAIHINSIPFEIRSEVMEKAARICKSLITILCAGVVGISVGCYFNEAEVKDLKAKLGEVTEIIADEIVESVVDEMEEVVDEIVDEFRNEAEENEYEGLVENASFYAHADPTDRGCKHNYYREFPYCEERIYPDPYENTLPEDVKKKLPWYDINPYDEEEIVEQPEEENDGFKYYC